MSASALRASGCTSGNAAAPTAKSKSSSSRAISSVENRRPPSVCVQTSSPSGASPRSASTFSTPAASISDSVSRSSSRVAPTHVKWAIVSMPRSCLIHFTISTVRSRVLPSAP